MKLRADPGAGAWHAVDGEEYNLYLVTTYAPVLLLVLRSMGLLMCWHVALSWLLHHSAVCAVLAVLVFTDCSLWHGRTERACGCLVVCAVALQTHTPPAQACSELHDAMHWVLDLAWAALSLLPLCAAVVDVAVPLRDSHALCAAVSCACFATHTLLACSAFHVSEWAWRIVAYHVACAVAHFGRRAAHTLPHTCVHILFTHLYVVLASLALLTAAHAWLVYVRAPACDGRDGRDGRDGSEARSHLPAAGPLRGHAPEHAAAAAPASDDLLLKLRAAKAQHNC